MRFLTILLVIFFSSNVFSSELEVIDSDPVYGQEKIKIYFDGWWELTSRKINREDVRTDHTLFLLFTAGADTEKVDSWLNQLTPSTRNMGAVRLVIDVINSGSSLYRSIAVDSCGVGQDQSAQVVELPAEFLNWLSVVTFSEFSGTRYIRCDLGRDITD